MARQGDRSAPVKVSAKWTKGPEKRLVGLALCLEPRIQDAAMAVFSAELAAGEDERKGQAMKKPSLIQRIMALLIRLSDEGGLKVVRS